jgi:peptide deformylase
LSKKEESHEPRVFINPEITWASKEKSTHEEGCLSIPEYYEEVERPQQVKVKYLDLEGKTHEVEASGLFATCLQHEIDHINSVLFIDHISKLKRDRVIKKFTKAAKAAKAAKKVEA